MSAPRYVIDTCSLIQMREAYRRKVFNGAWTSIENFIRENKIVSPFEVYNELEQQESDEVFRWIKPFKESMFISANREIQMGVKSILKKYPGLIDVKKAKDGADPFVIQTAISLGCMVITEERHSGQINNPKIPDVCNALGIECKSLVDLFEIENCQFK
jgi:hypothetical protein